MTGRIVDLTIAEAGQRVLRHRPVVVAVVVTLGILRALPSPPITPTTVEAERVTTEATAPPIPPAADPSADGSVTIGGPEPAPTAGRPGDLFFEGAAPEGPATPSTGPERVAPPSTTTSTAVPPGVIATAWATATSGPVAALGVPDGSLPVGVRVGRLDKASFLRLRGAPSTVSLVLRSDGSRGIEPAALQACPITTAAWEPGPAQPFDAAPSWRTGTCAQGIRTADGWAFDLGGVDAGNGLALLPGDGAGLDFQIAFDDPTVPAG